MRKLCFFSQKEDWSLHYTLFFALQVRNNVVLHAGGAGIGVYSARDSVIVHNTLVDVAQSMQAAILLNLSPQLETEWMQVFPPLLNVTLANNIVIASSSNMKPLMLEVRKHLLYIRVYIII